MTKPLDSHWRAVGLRTELMETLAAHVDSPAIMAAADDLLLIVTETVRRELRQTAAEWPRETLNTRAAVSFLRSRWERL